MTKVKQANYLFCITVFMTFVSMDFSYILFKYFDNRLLAMLTSQIFYVLPSAVYIFFNRFNLKDMLRIKKISIVNVFFLILLSYTLMPFMTVLNLISMLFVKNHVASTISDIVKYPLIIVIIIEAIMPAIFEETTYRGLFYNTYSKVNKKSGILLSALLFGLMHRNFNQFLYAFAMGIVFAIIIEGTNSILSSMIIHFVFNCNSAVLSSLLNKLSQYLNKYNSDLAKEITDALNNTQDTYTNSMLLSVLPYYLIIAGIGLILSFIIYRSIVIRCGRWEEVKNLLKSKEKISLKQFITVPLLVGMLICIIFIFINK